MKDIKQTLEKEEVIKMAENNAKKEQVHTVFQNISKNTID